MPFILRVRPKTLRLVCLIDKHTINHIIELEEMLLRTVVRLVSAVFTALFIFIRNRCARDLPPVTPEAIMSRIRALVI